VIEAKDKALEAKERVIEAKDREHEKLISSLEAKERVIEAKEKVIEAKELALEAKERECNTLRELTSTVESKERELRELTITFQTKERDLNAQLAAKEEQIRKESDFRLLSEPEKIQQLGKELNNKNENLLKLGKKVKLLERELAETKRSSNEKQRETQNELDDIKQKYFFLLALNIKINKNLLNMDVNSLYTRAMEEKIPSNTWNKWIYERGIDDQHIPLS